ncbi:hypothetical protein OIU34_37170 [Pararhizobium sp. BT-229]|uniref:hypothetical protein n=1 Tax=Pararhizobium sp. BT-229 TaxID=2986923 RepID=UPI0021F756AE|nr:hypothetical protein [Pararhizobium sp. BT-229]MCV9967465.1 hypothetical protein [Pararhizobium sp. BT-229]
MTHNFAFQSEAITPEDLNMLHGTLAKWCAEKHMEADPSAQKAAVELIDWFQFGLKYEDQLIEMLRRA